MGGDDKLLSILSDPAGYEKLCAWDNFTGVSKSLSGVLPVARGEQNQDEDKGQIADRQTNRR